MNRKFLFKVHSWIGINLSILFFIVCFSGTLATLSHEMDWLFIPESRATPAEAKVSRNLLVANFKKEYPKADLEYWVSPDEPYLCNILYAREQGHRFFVFANPYTGKIQGDVTLTFQRYFRDLHYYLFIPFQIGHYTVLIFAFLLLASLITAMVFFKRWYAKFFTFKKPGNKLFLFRNLHRLGGLWSLPFILLFAVTGIWYFTERTDLFQVGTIGNPKTPQPAETVEDIPGFALQVDYDRAVQKAIEEIPGLDVRDISPPKGPDETIYLTGRTGVPLVRNRANRVYVDATHYQVLQSQKAENIPTVMYVNDIADPLHFGNWGGLTTKIIWFFFGLIISGLVASGIWVHLKRSKKKGNGGMGYWKYVNWVIMGVVFICMLYMLFTTYQVSVKALISILAGWFILLGIVFYVFDYRLSRQ